MASFKQIGLAGSAAAVLIGGMLVADLAVRSKSKSRPNLRQEQTENQEKEDLEKLVWGSQTWTFTDDEVSAELRDYRFPPNDSTKFYFTTDGDEKERKPSREVCKDFQHQFLRKLYNKLEAVIGNRGFTGSEMLQLLSFYVDEHTRGEDRYTITRTEVEEAIKKLGREGVDGFKINLEKVLQPEKTPMVSNTPKKKDAIEDVKEQERRAYEGFKAGQKYAEGFKRGHEQYTREQLDQYANWRHATIDAQLNARLYNQCRRR